MQVDGVFAGDDIVDGGAAGLLLGLGLSRHCDGGGVVSEGGVVARLLVKDRNEI